MLRNRLKYALTYREVVAIVMQRLISIDGKVRTDKCYPAGFMGMSLVQYVWLGLICRLESPAVVNVDISGCQNPPVMQSGRCSVV